MSSPKVNARLEHVTRKGERRKPEEPVSWQDKLDQPHEDPLVQKVAAANGLPLTAEPAANKNPEAVALAVENARLKRVIHALELNGKKLERALYAEKVHRLDLEIETLMDEKE